MIRYAFGPLLLTACGATPLRVPPPTSSKAEPASALIAAGLSSRRAHDIAQSLADDVGPRLAGSPGDAAAVAWAERTMRELGFANVHTEAVTVPVWRRGVETAEIVEPSRQPLAVTALGWSGATPKEGITAEVVEVESLAALQALSADAVKGKIVFVNVPMARSDDGSGYGKAIGARLVGPMAAMKLGAAAFVVRSLGTASDRFPHAGATLLRESANPIAAGALSTVDADLLHRATARGRVKMKLVLGPERDKDAQSANVVGEIVGTTKKDEVVLLGAHLDSWDLGRGAIDDGAGCGIVLEATRLVGARAPRRTVRVVLFAAEENSTAGAKAYLAAHAADVSRFVLAMEADSGTDRARFVRFLGDPSHVNDFHAIARALLPLGITGKDGDDVHAGSDVSPLVSAGVPTIEVRQDASRYFDIHHTANDTSDKLDAEALAQVASAFAEIVSRVADMDG
ncbi:MAG TPA: M20/M25/M40 family metallo-hydrolase, partial [Polyangiaceae bacterium]